MRSKMIAPDDPIEQITERKRRALQWLRRNANAEKEPKAKAAFIECYRAIRKIFSER